MTPTRPGAALTDSDAVLTANLDFYRAFSLRNFAAMDALWAREAQVLCLHPGWEGVHGRAAVMESWRAILTDDGERFPIQCHDERVFLYGNVAIVLCEEQLPGGTLAATNIFVREEGRWRMIHHQASAIIPQYHSGASTQIH
ncbi:MAG: nuclear transport factor 2 family protein [Stellaceae bacterium]|jgi:ketosteroid isomerase-like protein